MRRGLGRGDERVQELDERLARDEVRPGDGLDSADGLHQLLRLHAAEREQPLEVAPREGLGAGAGAALPQAAQFSKRLHGAGHGRGETSCGIWGKYPRKQALSSLPDNRHSCRLCCSNVSF